MPSTSTTSPLLLAALIAGVVTLSACSKEEAAAPAAPPPGQVTVLTLKAQEITLTRELVGRVSAFLVAEVRPQVSGIVKERLFTEGGPVKAGQALYQLDDATYRANHASAKATLARAQATLKSADLSARRAAELAKIDAVSQQDNENAAAALAQAQADVAAAEAAVQTSAVTLGYARITSPISGRIGKSSVTQGALVTANQAAPLATVQRLDQVYVDVTQSNAELLELRKALAAGTLSQNGDLPVRLVLEDGTPYPHAGRLAFSDATVDPSTGSFLLRVAVPNPDNLLLPGTYVRAQLGSGVRRNGLLVPQQGIARDPKGNASAMVVNSQGQVEARAVQISRAIGDRWLVEGGLVAGDRVIIEGLQKIGPGMPVNATEAAPAASAASAVSPASAASAATR